MTSLVLRATLFASVFLAGAAELSAQPAAVAPASRIRWQSRERVSRPQAAPPRAPGYYRSFELRGLGPSLVRSPSLA